MKLQKGYLVAFMATAALGLSSCGGDPLAGEMTGASGNTSPALMSSMAPTLIGVVDSFALSAVTNPVSGVLGPLPTFASPFDDCTTKSGDDTNDDGDSFKKFYRRDFNCRDVFSAGDGSTASWIGYIEETDKNDAAGVENKDFLGGFKNSYDFTNEYRGGESHSLKMSGFWEGTNTGSSLILETKLGYIMIGKAEGHDFNVTYRNQFKSTYTPDDLDVPFAKGSVSIAGFFGFGGSYGGPATDISFEISSQGLVYGGCGDGFFSGGSISFVDGGRNTLKVSYGAAPGCTRTVTFNGNPVEGDDKLL